jgi:hypothetical protein
LYFLRNAIKAPALWHGKLRRIDIQFFFKPRKTSDESTYGVLSLVLGRLEKGTQGCFQFGSGIALAYR